MRPRLSRPSAHGGRYLEAFALRGVLLAALAAGVVFIDWTDFIDWGWDDPAWTVILVLDLLEPSFLIAAIYVFARTRSFRVPLAEWGWRRGTGAFRELSIGVVAGMAIWSIRGLAGAVLEPDAAGLGLWSSRHPLQLLAVVVWVPIVEETVYRGMLYRHLRDRLRWTWAVVISAAVFAVMHSPLHWTRVFASGLAYALLREWRGSLIAPIAAHATVNLMGRAAAGLLG